MEKGRVDRGGRGEDDRREGRLGKERKRGGNISGPIASYFEKVLHEVL